MATSQDLQLEFLLKHLGQESARLLKHVLGFFPIGKQEFQGQQIKHLADQNQLVKLFFRIQLMLNPN